MLETGREDLLRVEGGGGMMRGICLWLMILLLSGCTGAAADAPRDSGATEEAGLSATRLEADPRPLTEEEILAAYYRAEEAWGWFSREPLPDSGETVRLEGEVYRRVDYPGMETADDLRAYLRGLFSQELTDRLLSAGDYRDIEGVLYVSLTGRPRDSGRGGTQVSVVQAGDGTYSLEISVELLDGRGGVTGLECWSFPYAYVDGRWVFTDFQLVT